MDTKQTLPENISSLIRAGQNLLEEFEDLEEQEKSFSEGKLEGCSATSYLSYIGEESITVLGVLSVPENPAQLVYLSLPGTPPRIFMINLEQATTPQIRRVAKYTEPFQGELEGVVSKKDLTEAYNDAFVRIMKVDPASRPDRKKEIKKAFLAEYGGEFNRAFDTAMYRRGYNYKL